MSKVSTSELPVPPPRVKISVSLLDSLAKSNLWQGYLDIMTGAARLARITVQVERHRRRSHGGDQDRGTVTFQFEARSLRHERRLYDKQGKFEVDAFLIGNSDEAA